MSGSGNYVAVGVDTFCELMMTFKGKNPDYFDHQQLEDFFGDTINKFLFSFGVGVNYKSKKIPKKFLYRFLENVDNINNTPFMGKTELYWDSGGFQLANGGVCTDQITEFTDMYYDTVKRYPDKYKYAFIQDIPPGPGSKEVFSSYQQIEDFNRISYNKALILPPHIKKKMIYIHHFRTPELYDTFDDFLFKEDLADGYEYFGTGGIVANMAQDISIPYVLYTIPLCSIVTYAKSKGLKHIKFHVLGGANFVDVFYHKFFTHHIREYHGIDVEITYDSSAMFKGLAIGKYVNVVKEDGTLVKMDLRSISIHKRFDYKLDDSGYNNEVTVEEKTYELCNMLSDKYGFKRLDPTIDPMYDDFVQANARFNSLVDHDSKNDKNTSGQFGRAVHMYLFCYVLWSYRFREGVCEKLASDLYEIYKSGDLASFSLHFRQSIKLINQGKWSRKMLGKTNAIYNSLEILEELDLDKNRYRIHKKMAKDSYKSKLSGTLEKF